MYIYNMSKRGFILSLCCLFLFFTGMNVFAQDIAIKKQDILIQPDYLKAGDTVAIVAPFGNIKE